MVFILDLRSTNLHQWYLSWIYVPRVVVYPFYKLLGHWRQGGIGFCPLVALVSAQSYYVVVGSNIVISWSASVVVVVLL